MKKNRLIFLIFAVCAAALPALQAKAQPLSFGLKLPIELQSLALHNLYNNLEITGAYTFGELLQIESNLLVPITPLFVSVNAKCFFISFSSELCYTPLCSSTQDRFMNGYLGAGVVYTSVATELLWGFQGFVGLDWLIQDTPLVLSLELGLRGFNIFLGIYSGLFVNIGTRVNF